MSQNAAFVLAIVLASPPANATICKYVDRSGTVHYAAVAPSSKDWRKVSCDALADAGANGTRRDLAREAARERAAAEAWAATVAQVKIGMSEADVRRIPALWPRLRDRRTVETDGALDQWFYFADGLAIHLHNGRVATISR